MKPRPVPARPAPRAPARQRKATLPHSRKTPLGGARVVAASDDDTSVTSVEQTTNLIRQAIVQGRYGPGERIKISEAAERFSVSAMPVREALRKLEGEGMVSISPNRGATVRPVDEKFIEDIYEVRTMLEIMILGRCIEALTLAKLKRLEELIDRHRTAVAALDIVGTLDSARIFHLALFEIGGNHEAERLFQRGWDTILALRLRFGYSSERLEHMGLEFQALIAALRRRDAREAEAVIRMHNRAGMEDLLHRIAEARPTARPT